MSSSSSKAERVDAERDPATAAQRLGNWRNAAFEVKIRAWIGGDDRARGRDRVEFCGPGVDAMGERQARREQPKRLQALDDAFRIGAVGERALISGLEQMHMHAPAGLPRCFADRGDERIGTPLRTTGPELNRKESALGLGSDRLDVGDLLYDPRHRGKELGLDHRADVVRQFHQDAVFAFIDERVTIAHEHREGDAQADVPGGPGDFLGLVDRRHGPVKAGVVRHHRARAGARRASEGGDRAEIGVDRGHRGKAQQPRLERLAGCAERCRREGAGVIVRIDQRGHRQQAARGRVSGGSNLSDASVPDRQIDRRTGRTAVGRQQDDPGKPVSHCDPPPSALTSSASCARSCAAARSGMGCP